jgi:hypothetical protein
VVPVQDQHNGGQRESPGPDPDLMFEKPIADGGITSPSYRDDRPDLSPTSEAPNHASLERMARGFTFFAASLRLE